MLYLIAYSPIGHRRNESLSFASNVSVTAELPGPLPLPMLADRRETPAYHGITKGTGKHAVGHRRDPLETPAGNVPYFLLSPIPSSMTYP